MCIKGEYILCITCLSLAGSYGLCGTKTNIALYYNSTQPYMTFRFRDVKLISRFQIIITAAHTGLFSSDFISDIPQLVVPTMISLIDGCF